MSIHLMVRPVPRMRMSRSHLAVAFLALTPMSIAWAQCDLHDVIPQQWVGGVDRPSGVVVADIDGDGDDDLVVSGAASSLLHMFLNDGTGKFEESTLLATPLQQESMCGADLNGDGWIDIVTAHASNDVLSIRFGDGQGSFGVATNMTTNENPKKLTVADVNGDGSLDLICTHISPPTLSVHLNDGAGALGPAITTPLANWTEWIDARDINNDGFPDLAVGESYGGTLRIYLGTGTGTFTLASEIELAGTRASGAFIDLDHDEHLDLAATMTNPDRVRFYRGHGDGTFSIMSQRGSRSRTYYPIVADFDGDGNEDLLNGWRSQFSVWFGREVGLPTEEVVLDFGSSEGSIAIADLNRDEIKDIVFAEVNGDRALWFYGQPGQRFLPEESLRIEGGPDSTCAADFNGDGNPDLAVMLKNHEAVAILENDGTGILVEGSPMPLGSKPSRMESSDLDGDGDFDLVVESLVGNDVSVLLNHGDGTFASAVTYAGTSSLALVGVHDINQDDRPDILVYHKSSNRLSIFMNDGDGTFATLETFLDMNGKIISTVEDFNGDAIPDILLGRKQSTDYSLYLFKGFGSGQYADPAVIPINRSLRSMTTGDVNEDGITDLILVTSIHPAVHQTVVFLGDGTGDFSYLNVVSLEQGLREPVLSDLNHDGHLDLAVLNSYNLLLFEGHGDGTFGSAVSGIMSYFGSSLLAVDLTSDDRPELVVSRPGANSLFIVENPCVADPCPIDLDRSTDVGVSDLLAMLAMWGPCAPPCAGDLNGDGAVDADDLLELLSNWGPCS